MAINKVVINNDDGTSNTLVDLTNDDVTQSDVKSGVAFHLPNGTQTIGTMATTSVASVSLSDFLGLDPYVTFEKYADSLIMLDANIPSSGTASAGDVLSGCTFYNTAANLESKRTGTMPNIGSVSETIDPGDTYTIPEGYHDGTGVVTANTSTATISYVNFNTQLSTSSNSSYSNVLDVGEAGNLMRYGGALFNRASNYSGILALQGSQNNSSWTTITSVTRSSAGYTAFTGTNSSYRYYRLRLYNASSNNIACGMMMVCINLGGDSTNSIDPIEEDI